MARAGTTTGSTGALSGLPVSADCTDARDALTFSLQEGLLMLRVRYLLGFKPKSVWTIGPEEPVLEAIQIMADKHIGALPVLRDDELVGIVSERDYARKVMLLGRSSSQTPVLEVSTSDGVTVAPDDTV